jgi:hypothetical protein
MEQVRVPINDLLSTILSKMDALRTVYDKR